MSLLSDTNGQVVARGPAKLNGISDFVFSSRALPTIRYPQEFIYVLIL